MTEQTQVEQEQTEQTQVEQSQEPAQPEEQSLPPGFKSQEDYLADGGDIDEWKGPKAFIREHERILENRNLQKQLRDMGQNMTTVMKQQQEQMQQTINSQNAQKDAQIAQLSADLIDAHAEADTRKTERLTKQINKLESTKVEEPPPVEPNQQSFTPAQEALGEFIRSNASLDPNSGSYDKALENEVHQQLQNQFNPNMNPYAASKLFDQALADAMKTIPRYNQKEPKKAANTRQPGSKVVQKGKASVNSLTPEAKQMHDHLLHNMGTEKKGKEAADNFLQNWSLDHG